MEGSSFSQPHKPLKTSSVPVPSQIQYEWHEQERIMFVCLDPCTWQGREYDNHSSSLTGMKLSDLNTDQWCEAAQSWGAKEILFVAKHTGGFCWWQTSTTNYSVKSIPWKAGKGDLLEELCKSCQKYQMNLGIYIYPGDSLWGAGIGSGGKTNDPSKQSQYNEIFRQQMREVLTLAAKYVRVIEVWFDGSCVIEVGDILTQYAPQAAIFQGKYATIRWVGNEEGHLSPDKAWSTLTKTNLHTGLATQKESSPVGDAWAPLEIDVTLYDHYWFWASKNEKKRKTLASLMQIYSESVGNGAVLLLNSTPNTAGLIPSEDMKLYLALGNEISRRFDHPIESFPDPTNLSEFELPFPEKIAINQIMVGEDIKFGERVRLFVVEGWIEDHWVEMVRGEHIGRKRIIICKSVRISKIRFRILQSIDTPQIKFFRIFNYPELNHGIPPKMKKNTSIQIAKWNISKHAKDLSISLKLDLKPYILKVGQWELQFLPAKRANRKEISITQEILYQDGQESTLGVLTRPPNTTNILHFNRTAVVTEDAQIRLDLVLQIHPKSKNNWRFWEKTINGIVVLRAMD